LRSRWIIIVALCGALAGCRAKDAPAPVASAVAIEVSAPASLLGELSLGNPKETWQRIRLLGGDLAQALPSSLPVLLATSLSLPPSAAGSLDESLPMVGALLSKPGASEPDAVLGMHVQSGAELVASLTLGAGAKFRRVELAPSLVRLVSAPGAAEFNGALGVSGNYLLLATRPEALSEAGRFVAEVVPKRARTEPGLSLRTSDKVLAGAFTRMLRQAWQAQRAVLAARDQAQREAKGRAPDFADPEVLLGGIDSTVESWLGVLESSRELSLNLVPHTDRLVAELSLLAAPDGAAALLEREMVVGSLAPLLSLPASAQAALLLRDDDAPARQSELGPALVRLFGDRLDAQQRDQLLKAFDALAKSRRGASVVALSPSPTPVLVVTCEVSDAQAFSSALGDVLSLVELAPINRWLASTVGKPSLQLRRGAEGVRQARLRFLRAGAAVSLPVPSELFLSWQVQEGVASVVVAPDAKTGLEPLAEPNRLAASAWLNQSQQRLADRAALGLYLDARLLASGRPAPEPAPLFVTFGKQGERIVLSVDAAPQALRALSGRFGVDRTP
jgi:hypothetical protein